MSSPTQRTLAKLRKEGYHAQVVEKTIPRMFTKVDLFGAIDIVAVRDDIPGVLGIQCTSASNQAARYTKAVAIPAIRSWVKSGNRMEVWGWSKKGKAGARKLWHPTIRIITREDFEDDVRPL